MVVLNTKVGIINQFKKAIMNQLVRISTYRDYVGELTATYKRTEMPTKKIGGSKDAEIFIRPYFDEIMDDHEEAKIIHLNKANGVVNVDHLSVGGDTGTVIPIPTAVRNALYIKTSAVILVHNHPSGNLNPSSADKLITEKLKKAFEIVDLKLLDSIIITREGYYSFADEWLI
jgi:DNA repair protein RadC